MMSAIVTAGRDIGDEVGLSAVLTEPNLGDPRLLDVPEAGLERSLDGLLPLICAQAAEIDDLSTATSTSVSVAASRLSCEGGTATDTFRV